MVPIVDRRQLAAPYARQVNWRGRSGRFYALEAIGIDDFMLEGDEIYLVAHGAYALWAGSAADIVNDAASRARFRLALATADRVFHVEAGTDDIERLTIVWDLEGGSPVSGLSAA